MAETSKRHGMPRKSQAHVVQPSFPPRSCPSGSQAPTRAVLALVGMLHSLNLDSKVA